MFYFFKHSVFGKLRRFEPPEIHKHRLIVQLSEAVFYFLKFKNTVLYLLTHISVRID